MRKGWIFALTSQTKTFRFPGRPRTVIAYATTGYPTNLIARLLYGCGLRVTEPLNLTQTSVKTTFSAEKNSPV